MRRRTFVAAAASAALAGCERDATVQVQGGFTSASHELGHLLRDTREWPAPHTSRRTQVIVAGAGIAGLAAARALRQRGIEDFAVLDLEAEPGGNSRAGEIDGIACPLGAHYLPLPGDDAPELQALLEELGLRRRVGGHWRYDERHLVHAPQERLWFRGQWQEGLLPVQDVPASTLEAYRAFGRRIESLRRGARFAIPMALRPDARRHPELDALTFAAWLARERFDDELLRGYLDYCCRDDYGAGIDTVSAWAGVHYFAARHGFHAPGSGDVDSAPPLTWPQGNAHLSRALAAPLEDRFRGGRLVTRIQEAPHGVELDAYNAATRAVERWQAVHCIVALPVFVAARVLATPFDFVQRKLAGTRWAPWLVANLHLKTALAQKEGAAPAWDNVIHGARSLGYVDATHQSMNPAREATVLTWYLAPGEAARKAVLARPWSEWRDEIVTELSTPHPDLRRQLTRIDVTRYGHAMAIPTPGTLALAGAPPRTARLSFAHGDWASYSIFEEAFTLGHHAGRSA
ncbi:MAG: FAD-dependent oxidoreductase [Ramlibacter sp.]